MVDPDTMTDVALTVTVTAVASVAGWVGFRAARLGSRTWVWAILPPLAVLVLTALALNFRWMAFVPPTSWLSGGSERWLSLSIAGAMTLGALAAKVREAGQRRALLMLAGIVVLRSGTLPFAGPIFTRDALRTMKTHVDRRGVCLQNTSYNCGPAAAVTALRRLGFPAEEGQIGLLCKTDPFFGTADDKLAEVLAKRYGPQGLVVEHRYVKSVEELREWPVVIAVIKFSLFIDHYVAVLKVDGDTVTVGDPLTGADELSKQEFEKKWNHVAILLKRTGA